MKTLWTWCKCCRVRQYHEIVDWALKIYRCTECGHTWRLER